MNERILELAKQAGMIIGDTSKFDMAAVMPKEVKFAELIVKECADIATMNQYQPSTAGTYVIKHFGVEE
jgi:hypothetical protein